jgi:cholesterol transport system auxiliary component
MRTLAGLALLSLVGCVDLKAAYPERKYFALEVSRPAVAKRQAPAGTALRVRRFGASRGCEGAEFVYRTEESAYEADYYNAFFVLPATQATEQTMAWLGASGLFGSVVGPSSAVAETHVLEGSMVSLHGDYRSREKPVGVVEMHFALLDGAGSVLFQRSYRKETGVARREEGASSLVQAWRQSLSAILDSLESDLSSIDRAPRK